MGAGARPRSEDSSQAAGGARYSATGRQAPGPEPSPLASSGEGRKGWHRGLRPLRGGGFLIPRGDVVAREVLLMWDEVREVPAAAERTLAADGAVWSSASSNPAVPRGTSPPSRWSVSRASRSRNRAPRAGWRYGPTGSRCWQPPRPTCPSRSTTRTWRLDSMSFSTSGRSRCAT